jgi:hypothetical protein
MGLLKYQSQDQTLKLKSCYQLILNVRTSAHHPLPRQVEDIILFVCALVSKETKAATNSEADIPSSTEA